MKYALKKQIYARNKMNKYNNINCNLRIKLEISLPNF